MKKYARLYSDASGESHFDDLEIDLASSDYTPSAPPLFLSGITEANQFRFMQAPAGWTSDWHTSSARTMFFVLSGEWEVTASDGESRRFSAGSALLVEDTTGKGHASRVTSKEDSLAAMVELDDQTLSPQ
jgi:Cupin domain